MEITKTRRWLREERERAQADIARRNAGEKAEQAAREHRAAYVHADRAHAEAGRQIYRAPEDQRELENLQDRRLYEACYRSYVSANSLFRTPISHHRPFNRTRWPSNPDLHREVDALPAPYDLFRPLGAVAGPSTYAGLEQPKREDAYNRLPFTERPDGRFAALKAKVEEILAEKDGKGGAENGKAAAKRRQADSSDHGINDGDETREYQDKRLDTSDEDISSFKDTKQKKIPQYIGSEHRGSSELATGKLHRHERQRIEKIEGSKKQLGLTLDSKDGFAEHFLLVEPAVLPSLFPDLFTGIKPEGAMEGARPTFLTSDVPADILLTRALNTKKLSHLSDGPRGGVWLVERGEEAAVIVAAMFELKQPTDSKSKGGWEVLGRGEGACAGRWYLIHECAYGPEAEMDGVKVKAKRRLVAWLGKAMG